VKRFCRYKRLQKPEPVAKEKALDGETARVTAARVRAKKAAQGKLENAKLAFLRAVHEVFLAKQ
jgi:hypothetical protein